jgi:histidinol-phosphate aminotransferase
VPTFEMYSMYAKIAGARILEVPLDSRAFQLDVDSILSSDAKMIFLSSPNNPTGNSMRAEDVKRIINESGAVVVVDEAYGDFTGAASFITMSKRAKNLLVLRTLSKAYALPGLRVGFCMGSKEIIEPMCAACAPFRLNRFSEMVAIEALADEDFIRKTAEMARAERKWVSTKLAEMGAKVYPSETNFILFRPPIPVEELIGKLLKKGIAIRDCSRQMMLGNCARVTIGKRSINEKFIAACEKIMGGSA